MNAQPIAIRRLRSAAPLKRATARSQRSMPAAIRRLRSAAPLKRRRDRSTPACSTIRRLRSAAPLKRVGRRCAERARRRYPPTPVGGPIEARLVR